MDSAHTQTGSPASLETLRSGWPIIVVTTVLIAALALAASWQQSALYRSNAQVFVATNALNSALGNVPLLSTDPDRVLNTQAAVARLPEVARLGVARLEGDITVGELLGESTVTASTGEDILIFTVEDSDPERAAQFADAYAAAYTEYRRQLDTRSLRQARAELKKQIAQLGEGSAASQGPRGSVIANLLDQSQNLRTRELLQTSNSTLGPPAGKGAKVQPKPVQAAFLGGVIGLILGISLVFARDALNTRVRTSDEIQSRMGTTPLLGRIPPPPRSLDEANQISVLEESESFQAEAFRMLATSIELVNLDRGARSLMVTSAVSAEGKSTTAASVAVTFARRGYKVALVEADVRRPSLSKLLNLGDSPGLTDVVVRRAKLEDALVSVPLPGEELPSSNGAGAEAGKLEVLVGGPKPPSPGEFLKLRAVADVIKALEERADLVIIDTPPLLHLSDVTTMMLNADVDAVIIAVRLGVARRQHTDELKRILDTAPVIQLGFFVTDARDSEQHGYRYGYYWNRRRAIVAERSIFAGTKS